MENVEEMQHRYKRTTVGRSGKVVWSEAQYVQDSFEFVEYNAFWIHFDDGDFAASGARPRIV